MLAKNVLDKDIFSDCRDLSNEITDYIVTKRWNIDSSLPMDFKCENSKEKIGKCFYISPIPGIEFENFMKIEGDSDKNIKIPSKGYSASKVSLLMIPELNRILFGIIIHECTHVLQKESNHEQYVEEDRCRKQLNQEGHTPDNMFNLYICKEFETEARAAQAASEVLFCCGSKIDKKLFSNLFLGTHVVERTADSIGKKGAGSEQIDEWWIKFEDIAWDFHQKYV